MVIKLKIMRIKFRNQGQIKIVEVEMKKVDEFGCIVGNLSQDGRIEKVISITII